jgi:hypothetical protein
MFASLHDFQTVLGLCDSSYIDVESDDAASVMFAARWPCGCIACGLDEACLTHLPCAIHNRVDAFSALTALGAERWSAPCGAALN